MGCWHGYLSGVRCTFAYGPADPTATHFLLLQEIQTGFGFTILVQAQSGSPRQNVESCKAVAVVVVVTIIDSRLCPSLWCHILMNWTVDQTLH